ncbi:DNA glycosylase [Mycena polygramma]|nr:DNA glycosylase [Mycena polygramma]
MARTLKRTPSTSTSPAESEAGGMAGASASSQTNKKAKIEHSSPSNTPFEDFHQPTAAEAREVYGLLCAAHGTPRRAAFDLASVPNILEGLISTILSQSTSGANSSRAKERLDATFGRNNFAAIANASRERVVEAIRCGGLAVKKAATIQTILTAIHERHASYSLQFLAESTEDGYQLTDGEVTRELLSYKGVGPKTAACVLSLCLGREAFAVDTHVWRLSKVLEWVPQSANRVHTQAHLEQRLPGDLKYGMHALLMHHGRTCGGCKKDGSGPCILKTYRKEHPV